MSAYEPLVPASGHMPLEAIDSREERMQVLLGSIEGFENAVEHNELLFSFHLFERAFASPDQSVREDALKTLEKLFTLCSSNLTALSYLFQIPCILDIFASSSEHSLSLHVLPDCALLVCGAVRAAAQLAEGGVVLEAAALRDVALCALRLLEADAAGWTEQLTRPLWAALKSLQDDGSLAAVVGRALQLEAHEQPAQLSNAAWAYYIRTLPAASAPVLAAVAPQLAAVLTRHLQLVTAQLRANASDSKALRNLQVWLLRGSKLAVPLAAQPHAPLVAAVLDAVHALACASSPPPAPADGLPSAAKQLLEALASTCPRLVQQAALGPGPLPPSLALVRHSCYGVMVRAALPRLAASELRDLWPLALQHAAAAALHVPELLSTSRLSKNGHVSYAALYRPLAALAVRTLALEAHALAVLVPPLLVALLHPHPLAARLASDVLSLIFRMAHAPARRRLVVASAAVMRAARRPDAATPSRAYCQLVEALLGSVLAGTKEAELELLYDALVADEVADKRLVHLALPLALLPLARLSDKPRRHLLSSVVPLLHTSLSSAREATGELGRTMPCLHAIYAQLPTALPSSIPAQAATLASRKSAGTQVLVVAALVAFCDVAHQNLSYDQRLALLNRCMDILQRPDITESRLAKQPIARFLRHSEYLQPLSKERSAVMLRCHTVLFNALLEASEWEVVHTIVSSFTSLAKFAPAEFLSQLLPAAYAVPLQRPIKGEPLFDVELAMDADLRKTCSTLLYHSLQVLAQDEMSSVIRATSASIRQLQRHIHDSNGRLSTWQEAHIKKAADLLQQLQSELYP